LLNYSNPTMPTLRDIPTDVIQFVIFPFLDSISAFIANETLAPSKEIEYRIVKRIPKDQIIAHGMLIELMKMNTNADKFTERYCPRVLIDIVKKILRGGADLLIQHDSRYRMTVHTKMIYLLREDSYPSSYTTGFKKGLKSLARKILHRLEDLPFIRHVNVDRIMLDDL